MCEFVSATADWSQEDEVRLRTNVVGLALGTILCALMTASTASAQQATASGIAGVVKDTSGAVLPGVTVEAASPALIERVRSVVSDGEGRYNIVDLRPGSYTVTFTLTGFNIFKREGIELPSGFTATVNADLQVGAVAETITVTGAAPLVDTRNARKQTVVSSDLLNALPSSVKNLNNLVALTPGFRGNEGFDVTGAYAGQIGGTVPRQGRHQRPVRRHGDPTFARQPGIQRQRGDGDRTGDVDDRHLGRQQCRRRHREHDSEGGRQPILRRQQRSVRRTRA